MCEIGLWKVRSDRTRSRKAIADLRALISGHTRMALGNTRMDEEDDDFNVVLSLLVRV